MAFACTWNPNSIIAHRSNGFSAQQSISVSLCSPYIIFYESTFRGWGEPFSEYNFHKDLPSTCLCWCVLCRFWYTRGNVSLEGSHSTFMPWKFSEWILIFKENFWCLNCFQLETWRIWLIFMPAARQPPLQESQTRMFMFYIKPFEGISCSPTRRSHSAKIIWYRDCLPFWVIIWHWLNVGE